MSRLFCVCPNCGDLYNPEWVKTPGFCTNTCRTDFREKYNRKRIHPTLTDLSDSVDSTPEKSCKCDCGKDFPNPDIENFRIIDMYPVEDIVAIQIVYPDCVNHAGLKILVFENTSISEVLSLSYINPHFLEGNHNLIARFVPTEVGWKTAKNFVVALALDNL